mmetsp:Transcript_804/g.1032  ORF Transcript_804/g.1032 Transcript_804/m.1032 type:complete len:106 (-) Transcript_804:49-366(-)
MQFKLQDLIRFLRPRLHQYHYYLHHKPRIPGTIHQQSQQVQILANLSVNILVSFHKSSVSQKQLALCIQQKPRQSMYQDDKKCRGVTAVVWFIRKYIQATNNDVC